MRAGKERQSEKPDPRPYRKESGQSSFSRSRPKQIKEKTPESESDQFTDSEAEKLVQAPQKDDSRRKKTTVVRNPRSRGAPTQAKSQANEADATNVESVSEPEPKPGSSGFLFLLAAARSVLPAPVTYHTVSSYIPDSGNMFAAIREMTHIIEGNTKLLAVCPDYNSIAVNLYYSFVVYYQILRARDEVGELTREEKRSLTIFQRIGKPEAWPIAAPLSGFVQAFGAAEVPDLKFTVVTPALPALKFKKDECLTDLKDCEGLGRLPLVPAYQEFLRRFGAPSTFYDADTYHFRPQETPLTDDLTFVGLKRSTAAHNDFQSLRFNSAWNSPTETEEPIGYFALGGRKAAIIRWKVPAFSDTFNIEDALEKFLFGSGKEISWIKNLLRVSSYVCKLFPGSTNLGSIPPVTRMETFSPVTFKCDPTRPVAADKWTVTRENWSFDLTSHLFGDSSIPHIQAAATTATNASFHTSVVPATIASHFSAVRKGPFFENHTLLEVTIPNTECEAKDREDTYATFHELMTHMYDNTALD